MAKYKNKDGIELSMAGNDSTKTLIREVASEAVKICSEYNWWSEDSMRWALARCKDFLEENFDLKDGKEKEKD